MRQEKATPAELHHATVFVGDMDRAVRLFRDILGFEMIRRMPRVGGRKLSAVLGLPGMQAEIACLQGRSGGPAIELVRIQDPGSMDSGSPSTGAGLSLTVAHLESLHRKLIQEGWSPFTEPTEMLSPEGETIRMFCFRTEEGLLVELIEKVRTPS